MAFKYDTSPEALKNVVNQFYKTITDTMFDTIKQAAKNGLGKTNIFTYDKGQLFNEYHISFLLNGNTKIGLQIYTDRNIVPILTKLSDQLNPFRVNHWFAVNKGYIEVTWIDKSSRFTDLEPNRLNEPDNNYNEIMGKLINMMIKATAENKVILPFVPPPVRQEHTTGNIKADRVQRTERNQQKSLIEIDEERRILNHKQKLIKDFDDFYDYLLKDVFTKIEFAAKKGHGKTNLYSYTHGEKFNNHHVVYILKGPKQNPDNPQEPYGLDYFRSKGIKPVIERIQEYLNPFCVYHWYPGNKLNIIEITWEKLSVYKQATPKPNRLDENSATPEMLEKFNNMMALMTFCSSIKSNTTI